MKKYRLISFPGDIPIVSIFGAVLATLLFCVIFNHSSIGIGIITTVILALQSNHFWRTFGDHFEEYQNKIAGFLDEYFFTSFLYFISCAVVLTFLFDLKEINSFGVGFMVGVFFPFVIRCIYVLKVGYEVFRDIDLPHRL